MYLCAHPLHALNNQHTLFYLYLFHEYYSSQGVGEKREERRDKDVSVSYALRIWKLGLGEVGWDGLSCLSRISGVVRLTGRRNKSGGFLIRTLMRRNERTQLLSYGALNGRV